MTPAADPAVEARIAEVLERVDAHGTRYDMTGTIPRKIDMHARDLAAVLAPLVGAEVARAVEEAAMRVEALADRWERENRRPVGPSDQVAAGIWSATKHDIADLRALLARSGPGTGGGAG